MTSGLPNIQIRQLRELAISMPLKFGSLPGGFYPASREKKSEFFFNMKYIAGMRCYYILWDKLI
jgi:hypothetical protein